MTIRASVETLEKEAAATSKKHTANLLQMQGELSRSVKDEEERMKAYHSDQNVLSKTEEKFSKEKKTGKKSEKLREKIDASQKKVTISRNEYLLSLAHLNAIQERYFDRELDTLVQCADSNYHDTIKDAVDAYNQLNVQCDQNSMDVASTLDSVVSAMNAETDKDHYFMSNASVFNPTPAFQFIAGVQDEVATLDKNDTSYEPLAQRYRAAASKMYEEEIAIKNAEAMIDETCSAKEAPTNVGSLAVDGKEKGPADWAAVCAEHTSQRNLSAFKRGGALTEIRILEKLLQTNPPDAGFKFSRDNDLDWNNPAPSCLKRQIKINKIAAADTSEALAILKTRRSSHALLLGPQKHLMFGATLVESAAGSGLTIPKIVESCLKALSTEELMREEGIFRVPGGNAEVLAMRSSFEQGVDPLIDGAGKHDTNAIAGLLKWYLRELGDPVMTYDSYKPWVALDKLPDKASKLRVARDILTTRMPEEHTAILKALFPFLRTVAQYSDVNKMDQDNLATVFGPTLLQAPKDNIEAIMRDQSAVNRVTRFLLEQQDALFDVYEDGSGDLAPAVAKPEPSSRTSSVASRASTTSSESASSTRTASSAASDAVPRTKTINKNPLSEILHASAKRDKPAARPKNVKPASRPISMAVPDHTMSIKFRVRAKYEYGARSDQELSFTVGQVIEVYDEIDANWYEGAINGKLGCVASAYVEVLPPGDGGNVPLPNADYLANQSFESVEEDAYMSVKTENDGEDGEDGEYMKVESNQAVGDDDGGDKPPEPEPEQAKPKPPPRTNSESKARPPVVPATKPSATTRTNSLGNKQGPGPTPPRVSSKPKLQANAGSDGAPGSNSSSRTNSFTKTPSGPPPSGPPPKGPPPTDNKPPPPSPSGKPSVEISVNDDAAGNSDDDAPPPPPPSDNVKNLDAISISSEADEAKDNVADTLLVQRRSVTPKKDRPVSVGPSFAPPPPPGFKPPDPPTEEPEAPPATEAVPDVIPPPPPAVESDAPASPLSLAPPSDVDNDEDSDLDV